jgi:RHS repeat-associated protein
MHQRTYTDDEGTHLYVAHQEIEHETIKRETLDGVSFMVRPRVEGARHYLQATTTCTGDCTPSDVEFKPVLRSTYVTRILDGYGNATSETFTTDDGAYERVERTFDNLTGPWLIGLQRTERATSRADDGTDAIRYGEATYQATGAIQTRTIEPTIAALSLKTQITYDARGNVSTVTHTGSGSSRTTTLTWSADGAFPIAVTNPLNQVTAYAYDAGTGRTTHATSPSGVTDVSRFDGFGRAAGSTQTLGPAGPVLGMNTTIERLGGAADLPESVMQEHVVHQGYPEATIDYDRLGRIIRIRRQGFSGATIASGGTMGGFGETYRRMSYDTEFRAMSTSAWTPIGQVPAAYEVTAYDELDRVVEYQAPAGTTRYRYGGLGSVTRTDPDGVTTVTNTDDRGRTVEVIDGDNVHACYTYGSFDGLVEVLRDCGPVQVEPVATTMTYDRRGRMTSLTDPASGTRAFAYNAFDDEISTTNALNETTTKVYDKLGRPLAYTPPVGAATTFVWDLQKPGLLHHSTSGDGIVKTYHYDPADRIDSVTTTIDAVNYVIGYGFDGYGRAASITYPPAPADGIDDFTNGGGGGGGGGGGDVSPVIRYRYDQHGYLRAVADGTTGLEYWAVLDESLLGQPEQELFGNGVETTRTYEPLTNRLAQITTDSPVDGIVQSDSLLWTPGGDLERRSDVYGQVDAAQYQAHRLRYVTTTSGAGMVTRETRYDRLGNITQRGEVGAYTYVSQRLTSAGTTTYDYDDAGRLTDRNATDAIQYTWFDKAKQITTPADTITFSFDADMVPVKKTSTASGRTTRYVEGLYERDSGGGPTVHRFIVPGPAGPVAELHVVDYFGGAVGRTRYLHGDHLGSPEVMTDHLGAVAGRQSFDAWGAGRTPSKWLIPSTSNAAAINTGYTGHELAPAAGLTQMGGRLYDARVGRFTSPDPYIAQPGIPDDFNRYAYVGNNPLTATDPTGLCQHDCPPPPGVPLDPPTAPSGPETWPELPEPGGGHWGSMMPEVAPTFSLASYSVGDTSGDGGGGAFIDGRSDSCTGTAVHCAISTIYGFRNPVHGYTNQTIATIADAYGKTLPGWRDLFRFRPDLFNGRTGATYEIKSWWTYLTAPSAVYNELDRNIHVLKVAGFKKAARGPMGAWGTFGKVVVDGQTYAFATPEPGVVVYWPFLEFKGRSWQESAGRALEAIRLAAMAALAGAKQAAPVAEAVGEEVLGRAAGFIIIFGDIGRMMSDMAEERRRREDPREPI